MLHELGKPVIREKTPAHAHFERALVQSPEEGVPLHMVERKLAGFSQAEMGGYLLSLWGLPNSSVEAAANHHEPRRLPRPQFDATVTVYTENCLANERMSRKLRNGIEQAPVPDIAYLTQLGVGLAIPQFRKVAEKAALTLHGAAQR